MVVLWPTCKRCTGCRVLHDHHEARATFKALSSAQRVSVAAATAGGLRVCLFSFCYQWIMDPNNHKSTVCFVLTVVYYMNVLRLCRTVFHKSWSIYVIISYLHIMDASPLITIISSTIDTFISDGNLVCLDSITRSFLEDPKTYCAWQRIKRLGSKFGDTLLCSQSA